MKRAAVVIIVLAAIVSAVFLASRVDDNEPLALVRFELSGSSYHTITCEIAESPQDRAMGLIGREKLAEDRGMVFVYESPGHRSFWMKNTLIPLDIIFVAANGIVTNVAEAHVQPGVPDDRLRSYESTGRAKWVVEINRGICAQYGIGRGTRVTIECLD